MAETYFDIELFDQYGRAIKPILANTQADGSGSWEFPKTVDGVLQVNNIGAGSPNETAFSLEDIATDDTPRQISATPLVVTDVTIKCHERPQRIGDSVSQNHLLQVGDEVKVSRIDLSTLYARNDKVGRNGWIHIFGTVA